MVTENSDLYKKQQSTEHKLSALLFFVGCICCLLLIFVGLVLEFVGKDK